VAAFVVFWTAVLALLLFVAGLVFKALAAAVNALLLAILKIIVPLFTVGGIIVLFFIIGVIVASFGEVSILQIVICLIAFWIVGTILTYLLAMVYPLWLTIKTLFEKLALFERLYDMLETLSYQCEVQYGRVLAILKSRLAQY
jgi:hypothetical protein